MNAPNPYGCRLDDDVCMVHCEPLVCRHGCTMAATHACEDETAYGEKDESVRLVDGKRVRGQGPEVAP